MAEVHRAAWVLPIAGPPVRDGWVMVDGSLIVAAGGPREPVPTAAEGTGEFRTPGAASRVILPGLVNAHTHLELSWMRDQVVPAVSVPAWVRRLMALRRSVGHDPDEPIRQAIDEMRAAGTALVGDVTNTLAAHDALVESRLSAMLFRELLGFDAASHRQLVADARAQIGALAPAGRVRAAMVPHAPYSVSRELFREIAAAAGEAPLSVHLGESPEELEFLRRGTGPWRDLLEEFGVWTADWIPPACGPVEYLDSVGLVNERLIAVHAVHLTDRELGQLAAARATVVTCPRSNRWTGAGIPPLERFYASGVRVAIGTDSLASVGDLNLFNEMGAVRTLAPAVPARAILRSATIDGAEALGFGPELGSIQPGKRAELIAVDLPDDVADVEEYLVSGAVRRDHVHWLT